MDAPTLAHIARGLRVAPGAIRAAQWIDNGPGWVAALLDDAAIWIGGDSVSCIRGGLSLD